MPPSSSLPEFKPGQIEVNISHDAALFDGMWLSLRRVEANEVWVWPPAVFGIASDDPKCRFPKEDIFAFRSRSSELWHLVQS
jgi:hypothetical protein